jgi:DNA-cytosine methyltransferase
MNGKKIRLISLFSGYDSQFLALKYIGADVELWRSCEWAIPSIEALKALHFPNDHNDYSSGLSKDELANILFEYGISNDWNTPMSFDKIAKQKEQWLRDAYNAIYATHDLVDITKARGRDFLVPDKNECTTVLTWSFPCQSISLAGPQEGMAIGSGTRSALAFEVMRILDEMKEEGQLPHILLMENVSLVHSKDNLPYFEMLQQHLSQLGYLNSWADLKADEFGIPQARKRCFMVSRLGASEDFAFPKGRPLAIRLKDLEEQEKDVPPEYYLNPELMSKLLNPNGFGLTDALPIIAQQKSGYTVAHKGDGVVINRSAYHHNNVTPGAAHSLTTVEDQGIVVKSLFTPLQAKMLTEDGNVRRYIDDSRVDEFKDGQIADISFPTGYNKGPRVHDECPALNVTTTSTSFIVKIGLTIRKLMVRECWRLQGVKDSDFAKVASFRKNILYHLAGDSICVPVLMAIFSTLGFGDPAKAQLALSDILDNGHDQTD